MNEKALKFQGEFYIHQGVSTYGENFRLMLSWVLLGEAYPLTGLISLIWRLNLSRENRRKTSGRRL